jgi:hypothetical protein
VESSPLCRSAVEEILQTTALSQTAKGPKAAFHGQAFVDDKPYSL